MQRDDFKRWLEAQGFSKGTVSSRLSKCSWIEKHAPLADAAFNDLDTAFDTDQCYELMQLLQYAPSASHPLAQFIGDGQIDAKNTLADCRSSLNLYIEFKQGICHDKRMPNPYAASAHTIAPASSFPVYDEPIPADCGEIAQLWKSYCESREALAHALGRTNNILGELAERIVAEYHNASLLTASTSSADVELPNGRLIQVKSRTPKQGAATSLSTIRSWKFDDLAVLLFNENGSIFFGGEIDVDAAREYATEVPHVNGWSITTSKSFLSDPRFRNLTEEYNAVLNRL